MKNVVIVGGGISGLITAIQLAGAGVPCLVIEKKSYPFHRVCGEYISNEAVPFLKKHGLYPEEFSPPQIDKFLLTSVTGRAVEIPLDMGGFGISRFVFDDFLYRKAMARGVEFALNTEVKDISFSEREFHLTTTLKNFEAEIVIGAFGKRSRLDMALNRSFIKKRSPYAGIKYHIRTDHPPDLIALHNFEGGYCGISRVEDGKTNLCYLTHRDYLRASGDIPSLEKKVLSGNPVLKSILRNAEFLFQKPEVINEISFETKVPVEQHILMAGDAAGMITPLCGNGMAMAIHSGKLVSTLVTDYCRNKISREALEKMYTAQWQKIFSQRLWRGRQIQKLFGHRWMSGFTVSLARHSGAAARTIMRNTHGDVF